jgi:integrase
MAYFRKRKLKTITTILATVRRVGHKPIYKSFVNKKDAQKWARAIERKIDTGGLSDYSEASKQTLGDLIKRYIREGKHEGRKDKEMIQSRVNNLLKDTIADINLLRLSTRHIAEYRDRCRKKWSANTFNNHKSLLSIIIDTAITDWGIYLPFNPCKAIKRERIPKPRNRVLEGDEEQRLIEACEQSKFVYLKSMVQFSIETAIRQGELLKARREHINWEKRTLTLYDTKNGEDRTIPLSEKAFSILISLPKQFSGELFPSSSWVRSRDELNWHWKLALRTAKIKNLRWHDLRRHACSLLFEKGLSVPQVQVLSGHKDPRILLNTYTKLDPEKLVSKLG